MRNLLFLTILICSAVLFFNTEPVRANLDRGKIKKGIEAFDNSQWDESLQHFQDALLDDPDNPVAHYNVAEALYKKQKYEEALSSYEKALNSPDANIRQNVHYNLGNTYYQMNKYQEAIQSYIKALELNPDDEDAKHNLELVRAKLKEMAQKQPMQNQQQQQQQSGEQQQQQQNQEDQQQGDQQQMANAEEKDKSKDQQQQQQMQETDKKKELSKEEAERILQALRSDEKENQKLRRQKAPAGRVKVEKDW
ncbi:MAG: tetratricopeptide repeat protein [Calditrichaeota bacterium]|nr:tetratricopeptide repeat protein [Calditrichota bacterium]RQW02150.1 MAG: tetratricopeptide repeat protein [Calditrichota bacterium]